MGKYIPFVIKSFKHDGHLHRQWLDNWRVPDELLVPEHAHQSMHVLINCQTKVREADGTEWLSKIPSVAFFIPNNWYNVVALMEPSGIRYYCNIASPPYVSGNVITYIDYDLDVIRMPNGEVHVVDYEEYEKHKQDYHYDHLVQDKIREGLESLQERIRLNASPFEDGVVCMYFENWRKLHSEV